MFKSLHSRHNKIYLDKLRQLRESRQLRQADLGKLLGRSQGWVSYVECGETTLDIIELRQWLDALDYKFLRFVRELDADLREVEQLRLRVKPRERRPRGALHQLIQAIPRDQATPVPDRIRKGTKG
ncbi:helix-turn-helix domain-containing protein [Roseateles cellulosilyticus]|uniref:Helix-turn-helix domain-containing protein n=1 Tax=Pelomonas cellulosilytica TaxID=2906762 RepID=A0ABS8XZT0_9BURK|nr:helix-turn-helix transcriptional regulator [Pelomonas sp. P8]MCE4556259.1 helix-turn-helix domain-containing protein [Pelomonas sp. P8]